MDVMPGAGEINRERRGRKGEAHLLIGNCSNLDNCTSSKYVP